MAEPSETAMQIAREMVGEPITKFLVYEHGNEVNRVARIIDRHLAALTAELREQVKRDLPQDAAVFDKHTTEEILAKVPDVMVAIPTACHPFIAALTRRLENATADNERLTKERDEWHRLYNELLVEAKVATRTVPQPIESDTTKEPA